MNEIPEEVLDALIKVRDEGDTNLYNRNGVLVELDALDEYQAVVWVQENPGRYLEALHAMGDRIAAKEDN